jgi:hypothetical protein
MQGEVGAGWLEGNLLVDMVVLAGIAHLALTPRVGLGLAGRRLHRRGPVPRRAAATVMGTAEPFHDAAAVNARRDAQSSRKGETHASFHTALTNSSVFPQTAMSYTVLWNAFKRMTKGVFSDDDRALLFSGTAKRVYRIS